MVQVGGKGFLDNGLAGIDHNVLTGRLEDLVQWAKTRYQRVAKVFDQFDECWADSGAVVYCAGTLEGVGATGALLGEIATRQRELMTSAHTLDADIKTCNPGS